MVVNTNTTRAMIPYKTIRIHYLSTYHCFTAGKNIYIYVCFNCSKLSWCHACIPAMVVLPLRCGKIPFTSQSVSLYLSLILIFLHQLIDLHQVISQWPPTWVNLPLLEGDATVMPFLHWSPSQAPRLGPHAPRPGVAGEGWGCSQVWHTELGQNGSTNALVAPLCSWMDPKSPTLVSGSHPNQDIPFVISVQ